MRKTVSVKLASGPRWTGQHRSGAESERRGAVPCGTGTARLAAARPLERTSVSYRRRRPRFDCERLRDCIYRGIYAQYTCGSAAIESFHRRRSAGGVYSYNVGRAYIPWRRMTKTPAQNTMCKEPAQDTLLLCPTWVSSFWPFGGSSTFGSVWDAVRCACALAGVFRPSHSYPSSEINMADVRDLAMRTCKYSTR